MNDWYKNKIKKIVFLGQNYTLDRVSQGWLQVKVQTPLTKGGHILRHKAQKHLTKYKHI